ncbi:MAG TPA: glycosyltransferase [Spirochaetota bacterium]|nr:glycosyltransferase [Spirochaetota bacterium]
MKANKVTLFTAYLQKELSRFLKKEQQKLGNAADILRIDLHCHDKNSDKPGERLGRILNIPETWLPTNELLKCLNRYKVDALTITNHNNARSCWELRDKGYDILPAAEFTCKLPKSDLKVHVLTYGLLPRQEVKLCSLRHNLYRFLYYCRKHELITVWAHPLFFYGGKDKKNTIDELEHIATLFSHYEALNGQRASRQSLITVNWLRSFTPAKVERIRKKYDVNIFNLCADPYACYFSGGSDCHTGIFAGSTGTCVKIDGLKQRLQTESKAALILEGLQKGSIAPYGYYNEEDKMSISFLDFFNNVVTNMKDPGLMHILLHKGRKTEKIFGIFIANAIAELRRHKFTLQFLTSFDNALQGKGPSFWAQTFVRKSTRPLLREIEKIARARNSKPQYFISQTRQSMQHIFANFYKQTIKKAADNLRDMKPQNGTAGKESVQQLLDSIEMPAVFRTLFGKEEKQRKSKDVNVTNVLDDLSFSALASFIIGGLNFTASAVMNDNRYFLDHFAAETKSCQQPRKMLWLTDTFKDKNGVAITLNQYREEISKNNLPIDFLVCHEDLESDRHLIVTRPVAVYDIPVYKDQKIRIPDLMEIHKIFQQGNYDRVVCSTELLMGLVTVYLKKAFNIPVFFFMHTDWIEFARITLKLHKPTLKRLTRISRTFYRQFDRLFVLNQDHAAWLSGRKMNLRRENIIIIKHWVNNNFTPQPVNRKSISLAIRKNEKILLFVGRISEEKGLMDCPDILDKIRKKTGKCRFVFVGRGPAQERIAEVVPDGVFIDWIEQHRLPAIYAAADFVIFPSRFDTFGRVVLEALSCGCPVAAYAEKGPKDIIEDGISGVLARTKTTLAGRVADILNHPVLYKKMKKAAVRRAQYFARDRILKQFMQGSGLTAAAPGREQEKKFFKTVAAADNNQVIA